MVRPQKKLNFEEALLGQLKNWADQSPDEEVIGSAASGKVLTRKDVYDNVRQETPIGVRLLNSWNMLAADYILSAKVEARDRTPGRHKV